MFYCYADPIKVSAFLIEYVTRNDAQLYRHLKYVCKAHYALYAGGKYSRDILATLASPSQLVENLEAFEALPERHLSTLKYRVRSYAVCSHLDRFTALQSLLALKSTVLASLDSRVFSLFVSMNNCSALQIAFKITHKSRRRNSLWWKS